MPYADLVKGGAAGSVFLGCCVDALGACGIGLGKKAGVEGCEENWLTVCPCVCEEEDWVWEERE